MKKKFTERQKTLFEDQAKEIRRMVLRVIFKARASHLASAFSAVEILLYLYDYVLKINPRKPLEENRDRFILSKGWAASALYAILAKKGFFSEKDFFKNYCADGSKFVGITTLNGLPGIEATTGSMGHGLPIGLGMALAGKRAKKKFRVFVVISDGELDEGVTWEAILFAGHHKIDNLVVIIDYNKFQSFGRTRDVLDTEPLADKFKAFRWSVQEVRGHDFADLNRAFSKIPIENGKPTIIIARTVKGNGVSFIEDKNEWHYRFPNEEQFSAALAELS